MLTLSMARSVVLYTSLVKLKLCHILAFFYDSSGNLLKLTSNYYKVLLEGHLWVAKVLISSARNIEAGLEDSQRRTGIGLVLT